MGKTQNMSAGNWSGEMPYGENGGTYGAKLNLMEGPNEFSLTFRLAEVDPEGASVISECTYSGTWEDGEDKVDLSNLDGPYESSSLLMPDGTESSAPYTKAGFQDKPDALTLSSDGSVLTFPTGLTYDQDLDLGSEFGLSKDSE